MRFLVLPAAFLRRARVALGVVAILVAILVATAAIGIRPAVAHDSAPGAADVTITIRSGLSDREVRVTAGSIVRFVNRDDDRHRMRARSGLDEFDTGNLEPGEAYQVRLSIAGTYAYADDRNRDDAAYRGRIVVAPAGGSGGSDAGGSGASSGSTGGSTGRGGSTGGGGGAPTSATVTIGDDYFDPRSIRIAVGGTVTFRNTGGDEHSATSSGFDTGVLGGGASARKTFKTPGTFDFLCVFHSDMRGTVEVVAPAGGGVSQPAPVAPKPTLVPTAPPISGPAGDSSGAGGGVATSTGVAVVDFAFEPAAVEIAAGGSVEWTNAGTAPHTATAIDGTFDSGMLGSGGTFRRTFATPGTYAYLCALHPGMVGTVRVVAATSIKGAAAGDTLPSGLPPANGGSAASGATVGSDDPTPTATTTGRGHPAPTATTAPGSASAASAAATSDRADFSGIILTVTLVSVAAALFSRAVRGTVERPSDHRG